MTKINLLEKMTERRANISALVDQIIKESDGIEKLVVALQVEQGAKKYAYEKALRLISERRPELIYPYFDVFCRLLDSGNNFLKWGAIRTIANLTAVDAGNKFNAIFQKYFSPIAGPTMITAANIMGSAAVITAAKPMLVDSITNEILKVEKAKYQAKGRPSPECRNVAIGHAINALDKFFNMVSDKPAVISFVKRQLKNTRKPVAKKAENFIRKYTHCDSNIKD
jgi:hypothetical protein